MADGVSFYFDTFDIKDGMCPVWEAKKLVEQKKFYHCITEIKSMLSGPSGRNSFWFQLRIYMRKNYNLRAFFLFKGREFSYVVGTIKLNILWNKMEKQIIAYIKNRMCNLRLWGSSQEEVVY